MRFNHQSEDIERKSIGTFVAKTHLTRLLDRVVKGERIVITNRGKPVVMLVPPEVAERADPAEVGRAMLADRDEVQRWARPLTEARKPMSEIHPPDQFVLDENWSG